MWRGVGQEHIGLIISPNLNYSSTHEGGHTEIFILSSMNVSSCIMTAIWMHWTNCPALSLLPSKLSSLAALEPLDEWLPVSMFIGMACTTTNAALATASEMSVWASMVWSSRELLAVWS